MSVSTVLAINEVGENQVDKYITINDAISALERASNARYTNSVASAAAVTLSDTQATRYVSYVMEAKTGNFDLVFPSTVSGNDAQRLVAVWNATDYICTVKASTGAGSTVAVAAGSKALVEVNFEDVTAISSYGGDAPYDFGFFLPGMPADATLVMKFVAATAFSMADNFAGSQGHVETNPSGTATFDVLKNGSSIGSIQISTGGAFTFNTTGGAASFVAGDRISVTSPTPQDATLADVAVSFKGTRTF